MRKAGTWGVHKNCQLLHRRLPLESFRINTGVSDLPTSCLREAVNWGPALPSCSALCLWAEWGGFFTTLGLELLIINKIHQTRDRRKSASCPAASEEVSRNVCLESLESKPLLSSTSWCEQLSLLKTWGVSSSCGLFKDFSSALKRLKKKEIIIKYRSWICFSSLGFFPFEILLIFLFETHEI